MIGRLRSLAARLARIWPPLTREQAEILARTRPPCC